MAEPGLPREAFSGRRVAALAASLAGVGVAYELLARRSLAGALSLTMGGGVAIINFRWLETTLQHVIQPGEPRFDCRSVARIAGRMVLFGAMLGALLWVPEVDPVALALGCSALVVALVVEGFRWARVEGG